MDHAWYLRDVAELQGWRRLACYAWAAGLSSAVALLWIAVARGVAGVGGRPLDAFVPWSLKPEA
jgi:hypothetical protein